MDMLAKQRDQVDDQIAFWLAERTKMTDHMKGVTNATDQTMGFEIIRMQNKSLDICWKTKGRIMAMISA